MNVLSLFDGISCGQIALERAGICVNQYFSSEIDQDSIQVTQHNYPKTIQLGNVELLDISKLPKIDLLLAGSPCQGFSFAGKRLNFLDARSKLYFEFERILKYLLDINPNLLFLLENVRMKKEYADVISGNLGISPLKINSSLVSGQSRNRLYWTNIKNVFIPTDKNITLEQVLNEDIDGIWVYPRGTNKGGLLSHKNKCPTITSSSWNYNFLIFQSKKKQGYVKLNTKFGLDGFVRQFSLNEVEKLQTLPENYTSILNRTKRYKVIGNCWTVDIISSLLGGIF